MEDKVHVVAVTVLLEGVAENLTSTDDAMLLVGDGGGALSAKDLSSVLLLVDPVLVVTVSPVAQTNWLKDGRSFWSPLHFPGGPKWWPLESTR
jgi:hypothetical protein